MKLQSQAIIYTILADDKPVAALEANGTDALYDQETEENAEEILFVYLVDLDRI